MHTVAIVALDGVVAVDLAIPADAFSRARLCDGRPAYRVLVCGVSRWVRSSVTPIEVPHTLRTLRSADTIIVPGIDDLERSVDERILRELRQAARRGARIASVCSGAFVLARTGLLDGMAATTHWAAAHELQARHPKVSVDPAVLYVDAGQFLTSAGGMASLDLCLYMIRLDYGATVAAASARLAVVPLERSGGQAQYIAHEPRKTDASPSLARAMDWAMRNLSRDLSVATLAHRAGMSPRTFARRFVEQVGTTPAQWVIRARLHRAETLLETTQLSITTVAEEVGFQSMAGFRARFRELTSVSPHTYRSTFQGSG
jgi:transcriptional regulator GlxA family with amidase domain